MDVIPTDWMGIWAFHHPQKVAAKQLETGTTLTYQKLNNLSNRLVHHLTRECNCEKGDRIVLLAENSLEHLVFFGAAQKKGFILAPLNYRLAAPEIQEILLQTQPRVIFTEDKFRDLISPELNIPCRRWEDLIATLEGIQAYEHPLPSSIKEEDPIFILYTSGTTGKPKGVLYTHRMLLWNSINTSLALIVNGDSRILNVMPFFHTGGLNVLVTPVIHHGGMVFIARKFAADAVLKGLSSERITLFMGVPTMLRMMADEPGFNQYDLSSLLYLIVGGEPMPIPLIRRWHEHQVLVRQGYGMTEAGPNLTSLHHEDAIRKAGSIGKPNFYVQIRIADDQGREVPTGETGELWIHGPMVTPGFWLQPELKQESFNGVWLRTGDLVHQDEDGDLYVVDRIKNMYISGGENVYPAEVERLLRQRPGIAEIAIVGVPDHLWGEVGKAFIVKKPGFDLNPKQLQEFCRDHLAKFKIPKHFAFINALPVNDAGKVDRRRLKEL